MKDMKDTTSDDAAARDGASTALAPGLANPRPADPAFVKPAVGVFDRPSAPVRVGGLHPAVIVLIVLALLAAAVSTYLWLHHAH